MTKKETKLLILEVISDVVSNYFWVENSKSIDDAIEKTKYEYQGEE